MYIDKLVNLISPSNRLDTVSVMKNIELVEKHFNIKYPDDYINYITQYGVGQINDFITIYVPINSNAYYEETKNICQNYRDCREMFPNEYRHNVFPEKGGLLPLGVTDGGSEIWWKTDIEKEKWTIVVYDENSWEYEEYKMLLCEFLYKYFIREIDCIGFPESLREEMAYFTRYEFDFKKYCSSL